MKKILVFGASTSSKSINKQLANFVGNQLKESEFTLIDLNDYTMPIYSTDEEISNGFSKNTIRFSNLFEEYDGFIISLAEHNGYYTAAFKNMFDWASRVHIKIFRDKPIMLTATSPGKRGGLTVLEHASLSFPRFGAKQVFSFCLPSFNANFQNGKIVNEDLLVDLKNKVQEFENSINL
jgi:NAD(P)H-dependent FMN reductase